MREKTSRMPPSVATEPPLKPVPAPRATRGRFRARQLRNLDDMLGGGGENDGVRRSQGGKRVVLVEHQIFGPPENRIGTEDSDCALGQRGRLHKIIAVCGAGVPPAVVGASRSRQNGLSPAS